MTRLVAGGLAVLSLVAAAPAPAQKTPVFQVGLDLVNVTVTVRDGKGGLVSDLTAADFTSATLDRAKLHRIIEEHTIWERSTRDAAYGTDPDLAEAEG